MKCVILQPSYIPWRGYFHQILKADIFVFFDDVQYDKRGWRNRNKIKTSNGSQWLTIPVKAKGAQVNSLKIKDIKISNEINWKKDHLKTIKQSYAKAPFFELYFPPIEELINKEYDHLSDLTIDLTIKIAELMNFPATTFLKSSELCASGQKTDRLLSILKAVGSNHYISGPAAKEYIDPLKFSENKILLEYMLYDFPDYEQLYPPFEPFVSILDLLFMKGDKSLAYIRDK
ncbi:MAG: WbqC family protein [Bacteroidales bacterium]|nr:WbqC family protein [Bacteroidales bacterium]